jgi:signal transduction histidine kinase
MTTHDLERRISFLASALEQANATIRSKMDELSLVRRVGDAISNHTSSWSLCSELAAAVAESVNCKYTLIYTCDASHEFGLQALSSIYSITEEFPATIRNSRLAKHFEQGRGPVHIEDLAASTNWEMDWPFPHTLASWLCVPLLTRNSLRGVLCLADDMSGSFGEKTLRTLMTVVPQISSALANIGLYNHLRESEMKYRRLVAGMQDVVYICDAEWRIIECNPAGEILFGESIVGRVFKNLFASGTAGAEFGRQMSISGSVQNFETELIADRPERIVALLSCVKDGDRYSGIIKDVTERTRLFNQVASAQKMESIGTLAAGVAHDFNNILGIILPNAELIKLKLDGQSQAIRFADVIIGASKRAAQLTKQLLSLSRKDPHSLKTVSVNEAVRATVKLLGETVDRRIRMESDLTEEATNIKADETQIEQVLLNLAINARDAMPEGGVLRFTTETRDHSVIVRVSDTGTGIDRAIMSKIFDPFFTTKDKSRGTGLGLSVVYGIVKQAGGFIDVASEIGKGTEFIVTFPASDDAARRPAGTDGPMAGGTERILIVDDEVEILELLQTTLKGLGYSVVVANDGIDAVEKISDDIDLVILDMIMPVMDGLTAMRAIRQKAPDMKVLISSGFTSPEKMPMLERMGVEGFVHKPFELRQLASIVRDVLDGVAV